MKTIDYKELKKTEIDITLFASFNRYQDVKKCWRKENGEWILKAIAFTEQWGSDEYEILVKCLQNTIKTGGTVFGAFYNDVLVGFASIENQFFGSQKEYLQLSSIHISYENRDMGIGKKLFSLACKKAKEIGAQKLYISTHSSEESQAFYKAMGCVEAMEYNDKLVAEEPCDCQLEYCLFNKHNEYNYL
ncbi:GNAT family N-acetyltransferase [Maledivibacter halophilus]|uniref:N-acetylglutamate synthase and related acetyltransferases n=1 Tax=Maledivibacter halophilus TaxID=36842 RepID=A0A1T5M1P5_9FIRM|nr:GNAT family N-acetyltransferase [Maledivibacter halophilus]SKC81944.1 N-acetylglutamate synthase and related acetyltransferases [Maledivibacter halophilus]